jgi:GNAT superfamily N-acetyltransferase
MSVVIRHAKIEEWEQCTSFKHTVQGTYMHQKIETNDILVAIDGQNIVGILQIDYFFSDRFPQIGLLYIHESHRNQGIGKKFLNQLEQIAKEKKCAWILSSCTANEIEPQRWHHHNGFMPCGFIADLNGQGCGEIFMRKEIR